MTALAAPTGVVESGAVVTPRAVVANLSTRTAFIPAFIWVGDDYFQSNEVILGPGESDTVSFPDWVASALGWQAVRCSVALAGDARPENDQMIDSVLVGAIVDAGAVAIVAPVGRVDSGRTVFPVAVVGNYSTSGKVVPVRLTIGSFYADTRSKYLGPGEEDTVGFAAWVASELGVHTARCSVALAGDENPENDTLGAVVEVSVTTDVAAVSVLAPAGGVDSGAVVVPRALVQNLGSRVEVVPVHLSVSDGYHESTWVVVRPESTATVAFPDWVAARLGAFTVTCSTVLAGDTNAVNDTTRTSVLVGHRHDVGCYLVVAPTGTVDSGTGVTPRAMVTNLGTVSEDVPVRMRIGSAYEDSASVSLAPGESLLVPFASWSAAPLGLLAVRCSTELASDTFPLNDRSIDSVMVISRTDASVTAIVAPTGSVESGAVVTPRAVVANLSTRTAFIPVFMWVGDDYFQSNEVILGPGESDTVVFPGWVASPLGWQAVRCSTALVGDTIQDNDQMLDSVYVGATMDAAAVAIVAPLGTVDSGRTTTPVATIANYSTSSQLIPVILTIGADYNETVHKLLAGHSSDTVEFPGWTALTLGVHDVRCSVALAGDTFPENDTVSGSVMVTARIDAGVSAIVAPVGPVDSGTVVIPTARIVNNSVSTKVVPTTLTIGSLYSDTRSRYLGPGEEDTIEFAAWVANEPGLHAVRCSVALAGDENPENDTLGVWTLVRVRLDAAVLEVNAPAGVVDSGMVVVPKALVANYSVREATFPVHMFIETGYEESTSVTLAAGASVAVTFSEWRAAPPGRWHVACWAGLAGDVEPANDTAYAEVAVAVRHDVGCCAVVAPRGIVDS
ncbi:hypothetical protein FJY69_07860, partial [candidate division WOR-3 bacterium]|nr:hypothetical protein [candidate division WOR-3 bacterium]